MEIDDVRTGAEAIAAAMDGPFGRRKLQQVIDKHLKYFIDARASGALWAQICDALTRAGVTSANGTPCRPNALRVMIGRAEAKVQSAKPEPKRKTALTP